jgi:hypothetical protein
MPAGTTLKLLKDGRPHAEAKDALDVVVNEKGVYRVEAYVPGSSLPWILGNPIYVFDAAAAAQRAERAGWPPGSEAPAAVAALGPFEVNHDPTSKASGLSPLAFELAMPSAAQPSPFVALVSWGERDLSTRRGLVFTVESDGVYRLWVQVRDENPASADEGTEWWFASVKSTPERRRVGVPFEQLRSINPKTDGRLDLDKVRAVVFLIDKGSLKPGTKGSIRIADIGVY